MTCGALLCHAGMHANKCSASTSAALYRRKSRLRDSCHVFIQQHHTSTTTTTTHAKCQISSYPWKKLIPTLYLNMHITSIIFQRPTAQLLLLAGWLKCFFYLWTKTELIWTDGTVFVLIVCATERRNHIPKCLVACLENEIASVPKLEWETKRWKTRRCKIFMINFDNPNNRRLNWIYWDTGPTTTNCQNWL